MNNQAIIDALNEMDEQLVALDGLMQMAEVFGESQVKDYRDDHVGHVARMVRGSVSDLRAKLDETASMAMQGSLCKMA